MIVNMHFDRFRFQSKLEDHVGCTDLNKWTSYSDKFKRFTVTESNVSDLKGCLYLDGLDNLYKGIYSISNGLFNIHNGYYSWSVIKFYYSIFYLLRAYFSANDIGFLKNKGIYTLKLETGANPIRRDNSNYRGEKCSGDHKTTISAHVAEFTNHDIMLTNTIDGLTIYDWFMDMRNQVNYREWSFNEPELKYFPSTLFEREKIVESITSYFTDDDLVYCFNEDHALIAAPLKILQIVSDFFYEKTGLELGRDRSDLIIRMLKPAGLDNLRYFKEVLKIE